MSRESCLGDVEARDGSATGGERKHASGERADGQTIDKRTA